MSKHKIGESRWNASEMLITHICFIEESRHVIKIYCNSCLHTMLCNILDTFLDRATHSFGLDRDIFRQTRTYEPNSVTMKLEVLGFDSEDINVERESGGESADKEIRDAMKNIYALHRIFSNPLHSVPAPISSQPIWRWCSNTSCSTT